MTDDERRKATPIASGVLAYFPDAIAEVARHSLRGHIKYSQPGEPMQWYRDRGGNRLDSLARHAVDVSANPGASIEDYAALAWNALAVLQLRIEQVAP